MPFFAAAIAGMCGRFFSNKGSMILTVYFAF